MSGMTSDRLEELRRIAEAATPGPWGMNPENGLVDEAATLTPVCGMVWVRTEEQTLANAQHIAAFDPTTCLALLDEIERLRRERKVLAEALGHVYTCENCECALCPEGAELAYKAYRVVSKASKLLAGEEGVNGVTHFALYHPDLNAWECQADDCKLLWEFEDGNPYDHDMRFCPRCGRRIVRGAAK